MWTHARLLERHLFAALFAGGDRAPVLAALRAYQNADGGFGHGLEPDKRDPHSQPVDVEQAFKVLDLVDGFADPLVARACDWLDSISSPDGGVPFALPTVNDYPRAPWWSVDANPPPSLNPTASLAGYLLKHGVRHPWVDRASAFCWTHIPTLDTDEFHTLMPVLIFLQYAADRLRAEQALKRLLARIAAPGFVELDPAATGYVHMPLEWAPAPDSPCRALFADDVIQTHLAALAAKQLPDGGWPISWTPISPAVTFEWEGWVTVQALQTLRAYGALEG